MENSCFMWAAHSRGRRHRSRIDRQSIGYASAIDLLKLILVPILALVLNRIIVLKLNLAAGLRNEEGIRSEGLKRGHVEEASPEVSS
jgi:hypothetical protein